MGTEIVRPITLLIKECGPKLLREQQGTRCLDQGFPIACLRPRRANASALPLGSRARRCWGTRFWVHYHCRRSFPPPPFDIALPHWRYQVLLARNLQQFRSLPADAVHAVCRYLATQLTTAFGTEQYNCLYESGLLADSAE